MMVCWDVGGRYVQTGGCVIVCIIGMWLCRSMEHISGSVTVSSHIVHCTAGGGGSSVGERAGYVTLGTGIRISVTAITFSCATIDFTTAHNLQSHHRSVPLITCLYGMGG